ncbi:DUF429 domain-containing protein [Plantibacter sp. Mn2098]|uniref:DUF429 domain-containing protein n=1 Tax=Plantibacter sp. Mn2098 TaxID=3395266 RepID=UPI003BCE5310
MSRFIGVDLAWGEGSPTKPANETGLVCIDAAGTVLEAGWAVGIQEVVDWLVRVARPGDVIGVDAPLVVYNETGMRLCERQVGNRYSRWKVSAYPSNLALPALGGTALRARLEAHGFVYEDGTAVHDAAAITFFECYPNTTLVGAVELGYDVERPPYKRLDPKLPQPERRAARAAHCDELLRRIASLTTATPPLDLTTHPATADLLTTPSPLTDRAYKHREDLIDAALSAWTAAVWATSGRERCQVLGEEDAPDADGRVPVLIAIARPEQRRPLRDAELHAVPGGVSGAVPAAVQAAVSGSVPVATGDASADSAAVLVSSATSPSALRRSPSATSASSDSPSASSAPPSSSRPNEDIIATRAEASPQPDNGSTRAPSPAPSTVELLRSATWLLEHADAVAHPDDVAFEAARSALAEAVFDLEKRQYA